jgi:hypothetical protein
MQCPKCNKELMNINGRYICVECGTQVAESEVVDNPNDLSLPETTTPSGGEVPTAVQNLPVENEAEIQVDLPGEAPVSVQQPTEMVDTVPTPEPIEEAPAMPNIVPEAEVNEEPSIAEMVNVEVEPTVSEEAVPDLPVPEQAEPVTEPVQPVAEQYQEPDSEVQGQAQPQEIPMSEPAEIPTIEPVAAGATPQETAEPIMPSVETESAPQPTDTVVFENVPAETESPTAAVPAPEQPAAETPVDFSKDAPVDPFEVAGSTESTHTQDPNLYQNPIFDQQEAEPSVQESNEVSNQSAAPVLPNIPPDNKKLLMLLIAGGVTALLLTAGGAYAYRTLTRPTIIEKTTIDANNIAPDAPITTQGDKVDQ